PRVEGAAVSGDDRARDGEAEAAALVAVLGGEEGLEDARQDRRCDPRAVVADRDGDRRGLPAELHCERAAWAERVGGVQEEVHEHLVELRGVARDLGYVVEARLDPHAGRQAMADEGERAFEGGTEECRPERRTAARAPDRPQLREERRRPLRRL